MAGRGCASSSQRRPIDAELVIIAALMLARSCRCRAAHSRSTAPTSLRSGRLSRWVRSAQDHRIARWPPHSRTRRPAGRRSDDLVQSDFERSQIAAGVDGATASTAILGVIDGHEQHFRDRFRSGSAPAMAACVLNSLTYRRRWVTPAPRNASRPGCCLECVGARELIFRSPDTTLATSTLKNSCVVDSKRWRSQNM